MGVCVLCGVRLGCELVTHSGPFSFWAGVAGPRKTESDGVAASFQIAPERNGSVAQS
jgi:hypothetical protein